MRAPAYTVRESSRAKRISLRVLPPDGRVEVVIPQGESTAIAPLMVEQHRQWIVRQQRNIAARRASSRQKEEANRLPHAISFAATGLRMTVAYQEAEMTPAAVEVTSDDCNGRLIVRGDVGDHTLVKRGLQMFLKGYGNRVLPAWVHRLVDRHATDRPNRVTVRLQHTRWGSCSTKGNISLNAKLLLLPPPLVDHVILHELAHLRVANHSPSFWRYLATMDPEWKQQRAALRRMEAELPAWVAKPC